MASDLAHILRDTLSPDANIRKPAELRVLELLKQSDTGIALSELLLTQDAPTALRQSAGVNLRSLIRYHWSPLLGDFKGNAVPANTKSQIRSTIFRGLSDPKKNIRSLCAAILSTISSADWPDEYPTLLPDLMGLLTSGSPEAIHGSMQVLNEFIRNDLPEDQLLPILRDLLPVLLSILGGTEQHSPITRSRSISIFRQAIQALHMVKKEHAQAVKEAVASILPVWLEAFKVLLGIDPQSDIKEDNWDNLHIRQQIYKALQDVYTCFTQALRPYMVEFLTSTLNNFTALYPTYERFYIASNESMPSTDEGSINLPEVLGPAADFVALVARGGKAKEFFDGDKFYILVSIMLRYLQITDDEEDKWASDANAFVAQEDDMVSYGSLRVTGFDLFASLLLSKPIATTQFLQSAFKQTVQSSQEDRSKGNEQWWRPMEAVLAAIGSQSSSINDMIEEERDAGRPIPIDIESILTDVIPSVLNLSDYPFLQGRGFIFASQYASLLPVQSASLYIEAALHVIETTEASMPVKVSAVRAIQNFCQRGDDRAIALPYAVRMTKDLGPFILDTSEDSLVLVIETLSLVLEVDNCSWMTVDLAESIITALLEVWNARRLNDPMTVSIMTEMFETLAGSPTPGVYETIVRKSLPQLCQAASNPHERDSWVANTAVEMISALASGAPQSGLGDGFFSLTGPALFKCMGEAEDRDIIQNIITCLTTVIRKNVKQLLSWSQDGRSGLEHALALLAKVLQSQDESGGLVIGGLIIHLLRQAGDAILPVLPELLHAMVQRMPSSKTATFQQSLLIPFAFLLNNQRDTVLSLLEGINVDSRSGLDIFIQTFCENCETFQGGWATRQSTMAITQLYMSERPSLQGLMVKGDMILKEETKDVIMTRSKAKKSAPSNLLESSTKNVFIAADPIEFTRIPFPVKALKLLVKDVSTSKESTFLNSIPDANAEDGDDDWEEEEAFQSNMHNAAEQYLSQLLKPKGLPYDNDDILDEIDGVMGGGADDEDLRKDPIMEVDMQGQIAGFFKECASRNIGNFEKALGELNVEEMTVVKGLVQAA